MQNPSKKLTLGIPKGPLQRYILEVFRDAGFDIKVPRRRYSLGIDDPEIEPFLLQTQEIPKYVNKGLLDAGISGKDWILESRAKIVEVCDLRQANPKIKKIKWVLAVAKDSKIKSVKKLASKTISTKMVNLTRDYLKRNKIRAKVEFSWGATKGKPPRFADAIVCVIETGISLSANNLKILDTVLESSTKLIAARTAWKENWKKKKIEELAISLRGVAESKNAVNLMMHVPQEKLNKVLEVLPELEQPTVKKIIGENLYNVMVGCGVKYARVLIPHLKRLGCQEIVQFPIRKLIP